MKFETLFLRGLFGVCALLCGLTLIAMITAKPVPNATTSGHAVAAISASANANARTVG
ncbi:hypothetical protein [Dyella sp. 2HG41-7]|uniref:hypothetical protein n=1 Tax=Dyella sp. 2HG41-7 TaxID=2883239 RepID=UPI001F2235D7|nr:hypothetical protein [Dyella sp. 2HG41-7]